MPAVAHLFPEYSLLVSQFDGMLTDNLFIAYYEKLLRSIECALEYSELVDFRNVTRIEIASETLTRLAQTIASAYSTSDAKYRCAVVASSDLAFGLSRMYEMGESPDSVELRVFREPQEAISWLGLPEPDFLEVLDEAKNDDSSGIFRITV